MVQFKCKRLSKSCVYPAKAQTAPSTKLPHSSATLHQIPFSQHVAKGQSENDKTTFHPPATLISGSLVNQRIRSSAIFFLDPSSHIPSSGDRKDSSIAIPPEILELLESTSAIQSFCDHYTSTTHTWLPILSQKRLLQKVNSFNSNVDSGLTLLLLCMKLVSQPLCKGETSYLTSLYLTTKSFCSQIETYSLISLQLLQSAVLIAVYEIAHGIYPAAYLSVSHAARLGIMMGLHDVKSAKRFIKEADTWTECEEERRTWWAVVIFDR
jgi:hypothetical protein